MFASIINKLRRKREAAGEVLGCMLQYCQVRYMYERCQLWDSTPGPDADTMWLGQALGEVEFATRGQRRRGHVVGGRLCW